MEQVIAKALVSAEMNTFTVQCVPPSTAGELEASCCTEQLWNFMPDTITIMLQTVSPSTSTLKSFPGEKSDDLQTECKALCLKGL